MFSKQPTKKKVSGVVDQRITGAVDRRTGGAEGAEGQQKARGAEEQRTKGPLSGWHGISGTMWVGMEGGGRRAPCAICHCSRHAPERDGRHRPQ